MTAATRYLFLFFLLISLLAVAKEKEEPYLIKTKDFHVSSFSLKEVEMGITAVIYNPYKAKVKIDEIVIDVFIEDKKLGVILEAADVVKIPRQSPFDLPLLLKVKTAATIAKFTSESVKLALGKKIQVDFKGYVKVRAMGFVPIKVKIDQTEFFTYKDIFPPKENTKDTIHMLDPELTLPPKKQK
jgi:LEA14-like dessication related protein